MKFVLILIIPNLDREGEVVREMVSFCEKDTKAEAVEFFRAVQPNLDNDGLFTFGDVEWITAELVNKHE